MRRPLGIRNDLYDKITLVSKKSGIPMTRLVDFYLDNAIRTQTEFRTSLVLSQDSSEINSEEEEDYEEEDCD